MIDILIFVMSLLIFNFILSNGQKKISERTRELKYAAEQYDQHNDASDALENWYDARPFALYGTYTFVRIQLCKMIEAYEYLLKHDYEQDTEYLRHLYKRLYSTPPDDDPPHSGSILLLNNQQALNRYR